MDSEKTNEFIKKLTENPNDTELIMNFLKAEFERIEKLQTNTNISDDDYIVVDTELLDILQLLNEAKN